MPDEICVMNLLQKHMYNTIQWSAYNWIRPSLWSSFFGKNHAVSTTTPPGNNSGSSNIPAVKVGK